MGGYHHPQAGFVHCTPRFWSYRSDICYSCILNLLWGSPKISRVCDLWFVRYDLVLEVRSRPKWLIYLFLGWFRVWYITDDVFCKLHLPCVKKCDKTLYQGQLQGQGQLRSIIMLLWPEVKFPTWSSEVKKKMFRCVLKRETRWCLNYSASFLSS